MKRLALVAAMALAGCASNPKPPPAIADVAETVPANLPVPVSCVSKDFTATAPTFPDTREALAAAPGPDERYKLLAAGWTFRQAWEKALWDQVQGCR
jgi:hypothetical protein